MMNRSDALSVTILPVMRLAISSTGRPDIRACRQGENLPRRRRDTSVSREVCLSPVTCKTGHGCRYVSRPVDGFGERKESAEKTGAAFAKPNRKERLNSALRALLIEPNTSGIALFEDQQRRQSGAVFELVMDRSAERAAGGYDVV